MDQSIFIVKTIIVMHDEGCEPTDVAMFDQYTFRTFISAPYQLSSLSYTLQLLLPGIDPAYIRF